MRSLGKQKENKNLKEKADAYLQEKEDMAEKKEKAEELSALRQEQQDELAEMEIRQSDILGQLGELTRITKEVEKSVKDREAFLEGLERKARQLQRLEGRADSGEYDSTGSGNGTEYYRKDPYPYTKQELVLLAAIIEAEAGSTSYPGMVAVGSVVMNRVESSRFPDTIQRVIYAPHQFEPVRTGRLAVILARGPAKPCRQAAKDVLQGRRNVPNYYFKAAWYAKEHDIKGILIGGNVFH